MKTTLFENDFIRVVDQHRDYDFVGYVENKTDKDVVLKPRNLTEMEEVYLSDFFDGCRNPVENAITIKATGWFGIPADLSVCYKQLKIFGLGDFDFAFA